jgi:hypothetical protein
VLYVITGPPAAGKTTWVAAHARPGDIVIDLDRIAVALTTPGADQWSHSDTLLKVAHRARFAAIDEACRHLETTDVYLIHSKPNPKAMARYRRLQARIVVVDPGQATTAQRISDMRRPELQAVATRWYRQRARSRTADVVAAGPSRDW